MTDFNVEVSFIPGSPGFEVRTTPFPAPGGGGALVRGDTLGAEEDPDGQSSANLREYRNSSLEEMAASGEVVRLEE